MLTTLLRSIHLRKSLAKGSIEADQVFEIATSLELRAFLVLTPLQMRDKALRAVSFYKETDIRPFLIQSCNPNKTAQTFNSISTTNHCFIQYELLHSHCDPAGQFGHGKPGESC